jgi:lysophospholipase L1-like esterase
MLAILFGVAASAGTRIWCLGDSITGGPGCWRALLWRKLQQDGYTNTEFVGSLKGDNCGFTYDNRHDGHGGFLITEIAAGNYNRNPSGGTIDDWLKIAQPQITLMFFGTNDCWNAKPTQTILDAYTFVLNKIRKTNPRVHMLVAQITPLEPTQYNCPTCPANVKALNAAIPGWAANHTTAQSPIVVVDQWTGYSTKTDTQDGVHPNDSGNQKISTKWLKPLEKELDTFK